MDMHIENLSLSPGYGRKKMRESSFVSGGGGGAVWRQLKHGGGVALLQWYGGACKDGNEIGRCWW